MTVEFYTVGGCVRDEIMGKTPKDIDFSVVAPSFDDMARAIDGHGMSIVQEHKEFGTIRAVAKKQPFLGRVGGLDFVWARIDGPSSDGRRPDWTRPGTLMDDLARRDFSMNAIAKDADGNLIDPFDGQQAILDRNIMTVGHARLRFAEDGLRMLRAMRFAVTLGFSIDGRVQAFMHSHEDWDVAALLAGVSKERQREEMEKMFSHDTIASLKMLALFPDLRDAIFSDGLRLMPTMKKS